MLVPKLAMAATAGDGSLAVTALFATLLAIEIVGVALAPDHEAVQPMNSSAERTESELELVYYVLDGSGFLESGGGEECAITEGDMVHLPPGTAYRIRNDSDDWITSLIMAA